MCVFCVEVVLCCNTRLSRHNRANPLIRGFPGRERTTCCCCSPPPPPQGAGVPPERIVKVQIDVQAVDEELPVSWVNTHALAEVLKEWDQGGIESVLGNPKFLFTFPPNWIDVKCMNVLVQNIIQIETAFHSLIHLQNKGHFPGGSCVFNSPFGSPQFLFSSLALQRLSSVICGNQKKIKIKNALTDL